jgi:conjugative relaxase-like TrwC/TraI family protein
VNAELAAIYQAKLAAHPGATADERMRLLAEARAEYEGPVGVQYFDTTFSVDKTISLAHASALASAVEARQAGDLRQAAEWEARAAGIWAEIEKSVRLYVQHMQGEAAYVRTGHHGRRIDGVEAGRFEDAREIPVAVFPQHTSRNGDPQLHVHVLWLNKVQTVRDGQWRAIDSRGLYREKGAGSALAAFALETGLTRRFGFEWAYRPASKGRVIAGFPEKAIAQFSSRRTQITKTTLALAEAYEKERGHAPDQRALASMRQFANAMTRRAKEPGALDFTRLLRDWEQTSRDAELGTLRDLARTIWRAPPGGSADARPELAQMAARLASRGELTHAQERAAMAAGLAQAQESRAAWTRADLVHRIAQHLPDHAIGRDQEHAWQFLEQLTARAVAGQAGEEVCRLDAPEWPRVPDSLRRANGESIYRAHGGEVYATRAQLSLEKQLLADAQAEGAPCLSRDYAAQLLGADLTQLETLLRADALAPDGVTRGGLRLDQATAAFLALTSPRRAELIVGPAGTGKTYTAVRIGNAWRAAGMGQVYGVAATSAGRNVMLEAGIPVAENAAQFLGHLPGQRQARGTTGLGPDALLILDEASTTSMSDLAAIVRHAARSGAKVVITGDHAQLGAVQSGGGMAMLARKLGHTQLTEAVRFRNDWEGAASLAMRAGDVSALGVYDAHGRLHGGGYEEMAEQAARAYLTEYLAGTDVILTAFEHRECADLSRRVQGYLLDPGLGPAPAGHDCGAAGRRPRLRRRLDRRPAERQPPGSGRARADTGQWRPAPGRGARRAPPDRLTADQKRAGRSKPPMVRPLQRQQGLRRRKLRSRVRADLLHRRGPNCFGRDCPGQRQPRPRGPVCGDVPRRAAQRGLRLPLGTRACRERHRPAARARPGDGPAAQTPGRPRKHQPARWAGQQGPGHDPGPSRPP